MSTKVDFSSFNNDWYQAGGNSIKRLLWYYVNLILFKTAWMPISAVKVILLRAFGAKVGGSCVIKPCVNIKYPWKLILGDHVWLGENVWIDNLAEVTIGSHVCISQGAFLLCGNHNYKKVSFDLMVNPIVLEDGSWIGAQSVVCPGVIVKKEAVLSVGSVATTNLEANGVYQGIPAIKVKERRIQE